MALSLISLSHFTRPSRIIFGDGSFKREGLRDVLQWMVENRGYGYFQHLEYFQISNHYIAWNTGNSDALTNEIVSCLSTSCNDPTNFPRIRGFNLNSNGYNLLDRSFATALESACSGSSRQIVIQASELAPIYDTICWSSHYPDLGRPRTHYDDMNNQRSINVNSLGIGK